MNPTSVMPVATDPGHHPLLVRFGAMGDMVLLIPAIQALAERHGRPVDLLSSGGWTVPLLAGQPGVGQIHRLDNRKLPWRLSRPKRALIRTLRTAGPLHTWYCDTDDRLVGLLARAGIGPQRIDRASRLPMADGEHLVDFWQRFVGVDPAQRRDPHLQVSDEAMADLAAWLSLHRLTGRPLILIQPGNKRTMRRGLRRRPSNTKWWPEAHWATVLQAVAARHPDARLVLLGVPQEADLNDEILGLAALPQAINAARDLPLPRLLALQSVATAMISVDTGPAHTAAAVGCPQVVLFGVADPVRIRPRGGSTPVEVVTGELDGQPSMRAITPQTVIAAWDRLPLRLPRAA